MNKDTKKDFGIGIFFFLVSVFYLFEASKVATFTPFGNRGLDSQSIPQMIGYLSLALSVLLIITTFLRVRKEKKEVVNKTPEICDPDQVACIVPPKGAKLQDFLSIVPFKLLLSLFLLFLYFITYQRIGFIISSSFYLIFQSLLITEKEKRKKWILFIILFSICVSAIIYFVFTRYFTLFLPRGILG